MADYMSVAEAAKALDLSAASVRNLIKKDELPGSFRNPSGVWVIPAEAVKDYRAKNKKTTKKKKPASTTTAKSKEKKTTRRKTTRKSSPGIGLDDLLPVVTFFIQSRSDLTAQQKEETIEKAEKAVKAASTRGKISLKKARAVLAALGVELPETVENIADVLENPAQGALTLLLKALQKKGAEEET